MTDRTDVYGSLGKQASATHNDVMDLLKAMATGGQKLTPLVIRETAQAVVALKASALGSISAAT